MRCAMQLDSHRDKVSLTPVTYFCIRSQCYCGRWLFPNIFNASICLLYTDPVTLGNAQNKHLAHFVFNIQSPSACTARLATLPGSQLYSQTQAATPA